MYRKKIEEFIDSCRDQMIEDIRTLVKIPSVEMEAEPGMPYGRETYRALTTAMGMAEKMGFQVRNFDNRIMTAELNDKEPRLGIIAHLDVVDAGAGWSYPPYDVTLENGLLFGRGTADNKGPAIAALYAMKAVQQICPELTGGCRLILGTAEETGCQDLAYYVTQETPPPMSFSPDADYPVIHAEKGMHMPKFRATWEPETVLPRVSAIRGGKIHNAVPQLAEAEVLGLSAAEVAELTREMEKKTGVTFQLAEQGEVLHIQANGISAHVCEPEKGNNAQTALLALLAALPLADAASTRAIRGLAECFPHGDWAGKAFGVAQSDPLTGDLALSFSVLSLHDTGFDGQYDCRCPLCATDENMAQPALKQLRAHGFEIYAGEAMTPGHYTDPESPICKTLNRIYEEYTGLPGGCQAIGGFTYVHDIEGGVAFGCAMPDAQPHFHTADERFPVADLLISAKMFAQAIIDLCK